MDSLVGTTFAERYRIIARLGSGGMATVYKAVDEVLNRVVSIKILNKQLAENNKFVHYFQKEAQAVAALSHPNIVKIFDVGVWEEDYFIVMEYIEGFTLKEIIAHKGHLSVQLSLEYVYQILDGLRHAHSYGVIHRDIKPHNIMVDHDNRVKIMDFGLARNISADATITMDTSVLGSVHYIAPEIAQKGTGDARSDLYSTGIVLYEMLTGRLPFTGDNAISIALKHVEGDYDSVDDINPSVPYEVARLVDKAMEVDPQNRYQSAVKMMKDIQIATRENGITLAAIAVASPLREGYSSFDDDYDEPRHRNKTKTKTKPTPPPERPSRRRQEEEDAKARNKKKTILIIAGVLVVLGIIGAAFGVHAWRNSGEEIEVPLVVNEERDVAVQMLEDLGLKVKVEEVADEEVEAGLVTYQSIKEGSKVKAGRQIVIKVSLGADANDIPVPDVVGLSYETAKSRLVEAGFKVDFKEQNDESVKEGDVISQTPEANEKAPESSTVMLYVSLGPEERETTVPDVTDLSLEDAKKLLTDRHLEVGTVTKESSSTVKEGYVIYQSVKKGTTVEEGTTVNLTVSSGAEAKKYNFSYTIPNSYSENLVTVKVTLTDQKGTSTVYTEDYCTGGDVIKTTFNVAPPGTVTVYINDSVVKTITVN